MFSIAFEKVTLSNGLELVLHEDHTLPITAVNVWYHVGSKDEEIGRTGFAHLFEHMMFEGSKHHNRNYFEPLQKVGADLNGSTTADRTNYWETVPSNYLELALWLEADRMGYLLDAVDQKRFDVQRDVVKNERRQSYENRPYGKAELLMQSAVFPPPHPYSWPVIGSQQDLDAASLEDLKSFFRRFYAPSNASITIAGDFDRDEATRLVERYFGDVEPAGAVDRVGRMDSGVRGEVRLNVTDNVQLPRLYLVWPTPPMFDRDEAPLEILATILGDGKSSRLHRSLVYEKQIARDVRVGSYGQEIAGEFHVQVTASPGHPLDEIEEVVEDELKRIRRDPPDERELDRARNRIESHHVRQLERHGGFGGRADQLNHYNVFAGDPGMVNSDVQRYLAVTGEEVVRAASSVLQDDRVRMAVLSGTATSPSKAVVDRTLMPSGSSPRSFVPPVPQRDKLPNGLNVLYIHESGLPAVAVGLVLPVGAVNDPARLPGLANMTSVMLQEGTSSRSSQQIADEMEYLGTHLSSAAHREHAMVWTDTLTSHWLDAMEILADVVMNPSFPADELERVRRERLADLRRVTDDPVAIAHRASRAIAYGPESGHGHALSGTLASVEAMGRDDIVAHYQGQYGPEDATLLVVGDVTREDVLARSEALLGGWKRDGALGEDARAEPGASQDATTIYVVDKPGAAQSVIRAGHITVPRDDPDYYRLFLLNYVFGGNPMARLFMNLRQDKGYSYGYYSSIEWLNGPSVLFAGGAVQTAVTKEALVETLKEFADIRGDRPVTQEEFQAARDGILRGFPGRFETQGQLLAQFSSLPVFGLPDNYYSTLIPQLEAVTLDEVRDVGARRINDRQLVVLVVGDRQVIDPGLEELGLPIVAVDYDGRRLE